MKPIKCILIILSITCVSFHVEAKRTLNYRIIEPQIQANSDLTYAVAVLDKREVVTSQAQEPGFVGYIRTATMIAYPIWTESGNTFSDDVSYTISNSIEKSGAKVSQVSAIYTMDSTEVIDQLKTKNADVLVFVTLNQWRNDTKPLNFAKVATEMLWDLKLQVFDTAGELISENSIRGKKPGINPAGATSTKKIQKIIDIYYKEKMEELFSGADITKKE